MATDDRFDKHTQHTFIYGGVVDGVEGVVGSALGVGAIVCVIDGCTVAMVVNVKFGGGSGTIA